MIRARFHLSGAILHPTALIWCLTSPLLLGGCSGVAKGVAEAVIESGKKGDSRKCEIEGDRFSGVRASLDAQRGSGKLTKVLMVHGVSEHQPGYSRRFQKKLFDSLGLSVEDVTIRKIRLKSDMTDAEELGTLTLTRRTDPEGRRTLLFYELTWSPVTEKRKAMLKADSANNEGLKRADVNGYLKSFMNETVPDMLIYNGSGYEAITAAVGESVCIMMAEKPENLPENGTAKCMGRPRSDFAASAERDDYFFVTHSLGSRITLDALQEIITDKYVSPRAASRPEHVSAPMFIKADFTVFMLANQLPLLQMGRDMPTLATLNPGESPASSGTLVNSMHVVAFSDPNDILSYPVPRDFLKQTMPAGLTPQLTNVSLNLAPERTLFDAASFANPLDAHSLYMEDDRVIRLIAEGLKRNAESKLKEGKCSWTETRSFSAPAKSAKPEQPEASAKPGAPR